MPGQMPGQTPGQMSGIMLGQLQNQILNQVPLNQQMALRATNDAGSTKSTGGIWKS